MNGLMAIFLFYFTTFYFKAVIAQDSCQDFPFPENIYFDETSPAGYIIFVSNETNSANQVWNVTTTTPKVAMTFVKQTYQIALLSTMDLDLANPSDNCASDQSKFKQRITCTRTGTQEPVDKEVTFHVQPVNEYTPDLNPVPDILITEGNVTLPFFLAALLNYFKDRDCPKEHLMLSIKKYLGTERGKYFMVNKSTGYLYQIKRFDYEDTTIQCGIGKLGGFINITAENGLHIISKDLRVKFIDLDDTPPVFVNSRCTTTCYTCKVSALTASIQYADQAYGSNGQTGIFKLNMSVVCTPSSKPKPTAMVPSTTIQAMTSPMTKSIYASPNTTLDIDKDEPHAFQHTSDSTKNIIIIVLAAVIVLLISAYIVKTIYRIRTQKTKSEDKVRSYEEVMRNNDGNENEYATIQN